MSLRQKRNWCALVVGLILGAWAHLSFALPAGAVVAFNLAACPSGWTAHSAADGRVVVGVGTLGSDTYALGDVGGEARHTLTVAETPAHSHVLPYSDGGGSGSVYGTYQQASASILYSTGTVERFGSSSVGGDGAHENRPPYLALRYCSLDADEVSSTSSATQAVIVVAGLILFGVGILIGKS